MFIVDNFNLNIASYTHRAVLIVSDLSHSLQMTLVIVIVGNTRLKCAQWYGIGALFFAVVEICVNGNQRSWCRYGSRRQTMESHFSISGSTNYWLLDSPCAAVGIWFVEVWLLRCNALCAIGIYRLSQVYIAPRATSLGNKRSMACDMQIRRFRIFDMRVHAVRYQFA